MSTTKAIIKRRLDKKVRRTNFLLKGLMLLFIIVAYDSVIQQTPLYNIGLLISGLVFGLINDYLYFVDCMALNKNKFNSNQIN